MYGAQLGPDGWMKSCSACFRSGWNPKVTIMPCCTMPCSSVARRPACPSTPADGCCEGPLGKGRAQRTYQTWTLDSKPTSDRIGPPHEERPHLEPGDVGGEL